MNFLKIVFKILFVISIIAIITGVVLAVATSEYFDAGFALIFIGAFGCLIFNVPKFFGEDYIKIMTVMLVLIAIFIACIFLIPGLSTKLLDLTHYIEGLGIPPYFYPLILIGLGFLSFLVFFILA